MNATNPEIQLPARPNEIVPAETTITPADILSNAVARGASIEVIDRLMGLMERWERNLARKAFDEAIAEAKKKITPVKKTRQVGYDSKRGGDRTAYKHETLDAIAVHVDRILSEQGLSYRWRTESNPGEPVRVTCILSHRQGHSEENTLSAAADTTGSKNAIQAIGSTVTYLQRYTLKAALGLAAAADDDAASQDVPCLSDEQAAEITKLLQETKTDIGQFLHWAKAESVSDIRASYYTDCVRLLEKKKAMAKS